MQNATSMPFVLALLLGVPCLTGCPLSDDYYVERSDDAAGGAASHITSDTNTHAGGSAGSSLDGTGGSAGTSAGGTESGSSTGGSTTAGSAGTAGSGGSAGTAGSGGSAGTAGTLLCLRCLDATECDNACEDGWAATAQAPQSFQARERAAYTAMGEHLFVWGGLNEAGDLLGDGALYEPATDTWIPITRDENTPSARHSAMAVWTGDVVVVWGGMADQVLADGAVYDPDGDSWAPIAEGPVARAAGVTGYVAAYDLVAVWGGENATGNLLEGIDFYDPNDDAWTPGNTDLDPGKLRNAAWGVGTQTFWIFGGLLDGTQPSGTARYYSMSNDIWVDVGSWTGATRSGAFGALANLEFIVWGGRASDDELLDDGASYPLGSANNAWSSLTNSGAPSAREVSHLESGWAVVTDSDDLLVIGGLDETGNYLHDGGIYETGWNGGWVSIPEWPTEDHHAHAAVAWVAGELIVWGGRGSTSLTRAGLRYLHP